MQLWVQVLSIAEHTQCSLVQMRVHLKVAIKKCYKYCICCEYEKRVLLTAAHGLQEEAK